jgi:hypothetical protein
MTQQALTINKNQLPTIAELYEDNIDVAFKSEQLTALLNQPVHEKWVKTHPFINDGNYRYLPIDKVEYLLRRIFKEYKIEVLREGTAFNGVYVVVRIHYKSPANNEWMYHDGIGSIELQVKKGSSPSDLSNINKGALSMAFPLAKTLAVKDAADHFGTIFGSNLNRKDSVSYVMDSGIVEAKIPAEDKRTMAMIDHCDTIEQLDLYEESYPIPTHLQDYATAKRNQLNAK